MPDARAVTRPALPYLLPDPFPAQARIQQEMRLAAETSNLRKPGEAFLTAEETSAVRAKEAAEARATELAQIKFKKAKPKKFLKEKEIDPSSAALPAPKGVEVPDTLFTKEKELGAVVKPKANTESAQKFAKEANQVEDAKAEAAREAAEARAKEDLAEAERLVEGGGAKLGQAFEKKLVLNAEEQKKAAAEQKKKDDKAALETKREKDKVEREAKRLAAEEKAEQKALEKEHKEEEGRMKQAAKAQAADEKRQLQQMEQDAKLSAKIGGSKGSLRKTSGRKNVHPMLAAMSNGGV